MHELAHLLDVEVALNMLSEASKRSVMCWLFGCTALIGPPVAQYCTFEGAVLHLLPRPLEPHRQPVLAQGCSNSSTRLDRFLDPRAAVR